MNVEDILQENNLYYQRQAGDFLVNCLNPNHDDKHPSMRIDQILGIFNCFSCGFKGNIFTLFNKEQNKLLIKKELLRKKLLNIRMNTIGLQFPNNFTPYIGSWRNINAKTYIKFEAFRHSGDDFLGRICFPLKDYSGRIFAFIGRDETGTLSKKYLISPRHSKIQPYPTNIPNIKGRIILVEGIFDVLNLYDKGLKNASAIFGVNNFTKDSLDLFKVQGISGIDLILDPDIAGEKGAKTIKALCDENGMHSRVVTLSGNKDPGELNELEVLKLKEKLYG